MDQNPNNGGQNGHAQKDAQLRRGSLSEARAQTGQAEERFRLLVESVRDYGIFLMDPEGNIRSWNAGAERIKGYSADEVIGEHFSKFYTPEDVARKHPQNELEIAIKTGRYEEEGWRVRKDGSRFWANIVITTLYDETGKHVGFAKVTRDLTERRAAEERLKLSEERARRIFEGIKDYAMILLNPDGTIADWNEGARRIKGYEREEIIGKYFSIFYPEQDVRMGKCEYELREATETGRFEEEGWRVRKDGTRFWASVLITSIRDDHRRLIGFSKVTRDITDRKRADDLLKMAYASLEKRVAERTQELTETNARLQEAIHVRDEFLSIASHELRTPLTPLKLQVQSLISNIRNKSTEQLSDERLDRIARTCDRAITRLGSLIENLLDVSRINRGQLTLNRETVDLPELARELIERYRNEIQNSGCEVSFHSVSPAHGPFDRLRMEQVFINLLTNALKYGNRKPIEIAVQSDEKNAYLIFRDYGIGIRPEDQKKIFDRFERMDNASSVGGMGLGLYITRQIVEAHRGTIRVESIPGGGSTFTVRLPLSLQSL
jgi:PAS domain S-box-containing protein